MALASSQAPKRQDRMIALLCVIVGGVGGYLYYSQIAAPNATVFPPVKTEERDTLNKFKNISINFNIFESSDLKELKTFGESPVSPGKPGKQDIFGTL